jgi:hypothetical protein
MTIPKRGYSLNRLFSYCYSLVYLELSSKIPRDLTKVDAF